MNEDAARDPRMTPAPVEAVTVRVLTAAEAQAKVDELSAVLIDCVDGGASVSFMAPLAPEKAKSFGEASPLALPRPAHSVVAEDGRHGDRHRAGGAEPAGQSASSGGRGQDAGEQPRPPTGRRRGASAGGRGGGPGRRQGGPRPRHGHRQRRGTALRPRWLRAHGGNSELCPLSLGDCDTTVFHKRIATLPTL